MRHLLVLAVIWSLPCLAISQTAAPAAAPNPDAQQMAAREFGPSFTLDAKFPALTGDLDGDSQEDLVLVATAKNPLTDAGEFRYKVVDPYDDYFGFGDPKVTVSFFASNAGSPRYLLVVHAWRAPAPKAKYVIINLPFERLSISPQLINKKRLMVINAEEAAGVGSATYWDSRRKKYRWEPTYANN